MLAVALALEWRITVLFVAGVGCGVANAIAGGGTFITFPTLLFLGIPALQANVSTTIGVGPSFFASLRVFRPQLREHRRLIVSLLPSVVVGTAVGCTLLLLGSPTTFRLIVPWLIGAGTLLFALAPLITRRLAHVAHSHPVRRAGLFIGVAAVSVYGGYFGAGIGILLLAILAVTLPLNIHELQSVRNAISLVITLVAATIFLVHGDFNVLAVVMLLVGTFIGGWLGALIVRRLSPLWVRVVVIVVGVVTTVALAR